MCDYRFWFYFFAVIYCLVFPFLWVYNKYIDVENVLGNGYKLFALMYIVVMNLLIVRIVGRYIASAIAYPFSNICARKYLKKNLNAKFGGEFAKRIDHMSSLLKCYSAQGAKMSPEMLPSNSSVLADSVVDSDTGSDSQLFSLFRLSSSIDLYHLLAGNIELIELYLTVNQQILDNASHRQRRRYSRLFVRTTELLAEVK